MAQYEHKGIEISFDAGRAEFSATINGKSDRASSLVGIKKKIDAGVAFTPFAALVRSRISGSDAAFNTVAIVGVEREPGSRDRKQWVDQGGGMHSVVFADTPESRDALTKYHTLIRENAAEIERRKKAERVAWSVIEPSLKRPA